MTAIHSFQLTYPFTCMSTHTHTHRNFSLKHLFFSLPPTSFTDLHKRHFKYQNSTLYYYFTILLYIYYYNIVSVFSLPLAAVVCTVLKRGKAKKGKNDLISAEEGEDPFADISSVGTSQVFVSAASSRSPLPLMC